jgi:L-ribulose-5-phosphate 4-epimerase
MLDALRQEICRLHLELPRNNLVTWTSGNISGRDPESGLVVIKASGVRYEQLTSDHMVVVDLDGRLVSGDFKPSSDTAAHLYIYRQRPKIGGIVHTHSPFATAFAAVGKPIPVVLTAICDEFGGEIPCGGYAKIGGDEIGREVVRVMGSSPAVLLKNHGVFTMGKDAQSALKAAVMVEDVARTVFYALQLGQPEEISPEEVARAHRRYLEEYGR